MGVQMPDKGEFFHMANSQATVATYLRTEPGFADTAYRGECALSLPLPVSRHLVPGGGRLLDVLWAELRPLLSPRAVAVLKAINATGWTTRPVLASPEVSMVSEYRALVVTGRGGEVTPFARHPELAPATENSAIIRGWCFDPNEWDGSDLWLQRSGAMLLIVSARVAAAFRKAKVSGVRLIDVRDEFGW